MNYLGIESGKLKLMVGKLNVLLCNYHLYYQNLRNFHWNIKGQNFFDLHAQFEALYNDARVKIDEIAERILTLQHTPVSRLSDYLDKATIEEANTLLQDKDMVRIILENHRILIEDLRGVIESASNAKDEGTVDMAGSFLGELEKKSWMLAAWSGKVPAVAEV